MRGRRSGPWLPRARSDAVGAGQLGAWRQARADRSQGKTGLTTEAAHGASAAAQGESRATDGARHPKKSRGLLRQAPGVTFAWIAAEKAEFPITRLCRTLHVSPSGFYASRARPRNQRMSPADDACRDSCKSAVRCPRSEPVPVPEHPTPALPACSPIASGVRCTSDHRANTSMSAAMRGTCRLMPSLSKRLACRLSGFRAKRYKGTSSMSAITISRVADQWHARSASTSTDGRDRINGNVLVDHDGVRHTHRLARKHIE